MRIGVVADTHVGEHLPRLPPAVADALAGVDLILHAGDICAGGVLEELRRLAPVVAVRGNHDRRGAPARLPRDVVVRVGEVRIGLTHGTRPPPVEILSGLLTLATGRLFLGPFVTAARRRFGDVDAVVVGHLHVPLRAFRGGALVFSPGAVYVAEGDRRRRWGPVERRLYRRFRAACPPGSEAPRVGVLEVRGARVRARSEVLAGAAAPSP